MTLPGILASGGLAPGAPTIGTATDGGNGTSVSVAFTAPTWTGKGTGTVTYTATSSPGGLTGTSTSSPITVSGLTSGTAYTFTVRATTSYGVTGPASASSNSVTPALPGAFDSIVSATPTGVGSVNFTNIPQTYQMLHLRIVSRLVTTGTSSLSNLNVRPNDIGTGIYYRTNMNAQSTSVSNDYGTSTAAFAYTYPNTSAGDLYTGVTIMEISNYNTSRNKTIRTVSGGAAGTNSAIDYANISLETSNAITSITISSSSGDNFNAGTTISLYGIKGS